jgi:hypothetical protein
MLSKAWSSYTLFVAMKEFAVEEDGIVARPGSPAGIVQAFP